MPQYRVEISPNNRAGCKDSVCNREKIKITKGEIRFGTWVEIQEHGSWAWKHWGCVSGSQLQNLRDECDKGDGELDFDIIDGYDELTDAGIREKIRRCVKQSHIDAEDFNGDPEKNRPGEKGIHLTAKQKAARAAAAEAAAAAANESEDEKPEDVKPKKTAKRGRGKKANEEDEDDEPVAKRSKTAKNAKSSKVDEPTPVKKPRGRKAAVKEESDEEDEKREEEEEEEKPAPVKKPRGRKAVVKKESDDEEDGEEEKEEEDESDKAAAKKAKSKVGAKSAVAKTPKKSKRQSTNKAAADQDAADEKPAPKAKGRRETRRSTKA